MIPALLREPTFRRFWTGQTISLFGDQVSLFAIPLTAVLVLHAGPAQMGLLTAAGLVPSLLFSLHAGSWVDRRGRRRQIMIVADVARFLLMASIPLAYVLGGLGLPQLYLVTFVIGAFDVLFAVADGSLFVAIVDPDQYVEGQALLNGSRALSFVAGQSLAGLLVALVRAPGALVLDAFSFLASALTLRGIRPVEPPPAEGDGARTLAGLRFIRSSPVVRAALAATATVNVFTFAFSAIFILFATQELHVRPAVLGLVLGGGAVGGVLGSVLTGRVARRVGFGPAFALGCVAFPAPLALVPLAGGSHWTVLACLFLSEFLSGLGVMLLDIAIGAIFAAVIPNAMRARVSGAYRMVNYGVRPLGAVLGGTLGATIGLRPTLWLAVAGASACVLWLLPSPVMRLQRAEPERVAQLVG